MWPGHSSSATAEIPVEARRCTVQLSTGRLYLDAAATAATALFGHDSPSQILTADAAAVQQMLSSLAAGYVCIAMTSCFISAANLAGQLAGVLAGLSGRVLEMDAIDGEGKRHTSGDLFVVAYENETLARTGRWLASAAWHRPPDLIVLGDALSRGSPFGAVLARESLAAKLNFTGKGAGIATESADSASLARVAAAVTMVEGEGLLPHGREVADYLMNRLTAVRDSCPQFESICATGLAFRIALAPPFTAPQIRRRMCERGVLVAVDDQSRLAINPPLPLRIAEADVITGTLRGALLDSPMPSAPACCAACVSE
jgi:acetylornithine/succinyldiaminopimelate/putrescine aminotransferase